jgi:MFS family permease
LCLFTIGFINAVGVFQTYYEQNQLAQDTPFKIGWVLSFLVFLMNLGVYLLIGLTDEQGIVVGPLFDIFGPSWLLIVGTILTTFGLMMTSLCHDYYQFFLAQGLVTGVGLSVVFQIAILCVNTWFLKKRGLAVGLMVSGSSLGGVCFPVMLKRLFNSVGFGWGVRSAAFLIFGCLVIANFLVKSRLPPPGWRNTRQIFDWAALKEPVFVFVCFACYFTYWGLFTPFTFLPSYAIAHGMDENLAFYLISIVNAASVFGRILPGILADRVGAYNVQVVATFIMAISVLAYWTPSTNNAAIITFGIFYGFVSGAFISLFAVCCVMISPIKRIGGRFGLMCGFNAIAALTGIPISGALQIQGTWARGFGPMILFSGLCCVIGSAFYCAARVKMVGWKLNVKR